jgi:hypothetical protein
VICQSISINTVGADQHILDVKIPSEKWAGWGKEVDGQHDDVFPTELEALVCGQVGRERVTVCTHKGGDGRISKHSIDDDAVGRLGIGLSHGEALLGAHKARDRWVVLMEEHGESV